MDSQKFPRVDLIATVIIFFLGLFLFGKFGPGLPLSVNSITSNQPQPFTVSAEGKVVAKPDTAQVSLGVQTQGSSVKAAQDQANTIINSTTAALKKLGVNEKDIKTINYSVYPDEQFDTVLQAPEPATETAPMVGSAKPAILPQPTLPFPRKITKYRVNVNLSVTVRDFDLLNQVIDAATANGVNQIGGINFTVENIDQFQSQARKIAIDNARAKAAEIAKQAGVNLVRIINVTEGSNNYPAPLMRADMAQGSDSTATKVEPGSSEISVTVTLSYETR